MVETEADCMDIVHQISAIQGSLRKVKALLIEDYLARQLPNALDRNGPDDHAYILGQVAKILNSAE
jgi:DNA-binding FrmR family transcriptional regulator